MELRQHQAHWQGIVDLYINTKTVATMSSEDFTTAVRAIERLAVVALTLDKSARRQLEYRTIVYNAWKLVMCQRFDEQFLVRFGGVDFARELLSLLDRHHDVPHSIRALRDKVSALL